MNQWTDKSTTEKISTQHYRTIQWHSLVKSPACVHIRVRGRLLDDDKLCEQTDVPYDVTEHFSINSFSHSAFLHRRESSTTSSSLTPFLPILCIFEVKKIFIHIFFRVFINLKSRIFMEMLTGKKFNL